MTPIFISYRRDDSRHIAGRIADRLAATFGRDQLFVDVDAVEPGLDFLEVIQEKVHECRVLLAVIGPTWLEAKDEIGRRRLDIADDFVRYEIETALSRGVRVIPILVDGARMPRADELPDNLVAFARRNALRIDHERFNGDADQIVQLLAKVLIPEKPATAPPSPMAGSIVKPEEAGVEAVIAAAAKEWTHKELFRAPDIPATKEQGAKAGAALPADERIIAMFDCTVFGSAKDCIVLGTRGLYHRNNHAAPKFMSYETFATSRIEKTGWWEITVGDQKIDTSGGGSTEMITVMLTKLQTALKQIFN